MAFSRRDFLRTGAVAASLASAGGAARPLLAQLDGRRPVAIPPMDDPRLKELALRAVDAARSAGAAYADARLTHDIKRILSPGTCDDWEILSVGVRALVDGYWGFASGPVWSPDEMGRLGREAVHQAKANTLGKPRLVDLAPAPVVTAGAWTMPVRVDPFELSPSEIKDLLRSLEIYTYRTPGIEILSNQCQMFKQEKVFASTTDSFFTQRVYRSSGTFSFRLRTEAGVGEGGLASLSSAGLGWELYRDQPLREQIREALEEMRADMKLPAKPVEVGKYDVVFDPRGLANLLQRTLQPATELDRALGYEANAGGTSFLNEPFEMLGSYQMGTAALTVTGNRTESGGAATVQWDDEAVAPPVFPIIREGLLVDFQTMRESGGWLKDAYARSKRPVRSNGCAAAVAGISAPLQRSPNLRLEAGREALDFEALIGGMSRGVAIRGADFDMDFQGQSGLGIGKTYEIKGGKRVAILSAAGLLFRSSEIWKSLLTLGGPKASERYGVLTTKGEPAQEHYASITAPPGVFRQLTVIDALRKA